MDPSASPLSLALSHHSDSDPTPGPSSRIKRERNLRVVMWRGWLRAYLHRWQWTQTLTRCCGPIRDMPIDHALLVMHHVRGQRPADSHADRAVDLPAALHRIDQPPNISGVNAVQDADLRSDAMHRQTDALHVERDGARGEVGFAPGLKVVTILLTGGVEIGQRDPVVAAKHGLGLQL